MKATTITAASLAALFFSALVTAQSADSSVSLNPIVVTGSAFPHALDRSIQSIEVITSEEIRETPAATLAELLSLVAGIDVQRRGGPGVQADIGIRGSTFEQTLVLLNGIPLRDPQTGHHSLNLPVSLETIDRIEIVKGPGGLAFGGHATGGLINIITRVPDATEGGIRARAGSHEFGEVAAWLGTGDAQGGQILSAEASRSDGHIDDQPTDFQLARASLTGQRQIGATALRWGLGYDRRKFGAFKFYTADFPDQRERTRTRLAYVTGERPLGAWKIEARGWWPHARALLVALHMGNVLTYSAYFKRKALLDRFETARETDATLSLRRFMQTEMRGGRRSGDGGSR
ncbi:MAG: TonB-dependent receptor, partial [Wenzhouxiangellaceae bacterium]